MKLIMICAAVLLSGCTPWEVQLAEEVVQVIEQEVTPPGSRHEYEPVPPRGMNGPTEPTSCA